MAVEYLGNSGFVADGGTFTPNASTDFFLIGLIGESTGGAGAQWTDVSWDGLTDADDPATAINFHKRTDTNSVSSALWYLTAPDVTGLGTLNFTDSVQNSDRACVMYFRRVGLDDPIYSDDTDFGGPDNETVDPGWRKDAVKVCVVSHNGTAEVPASGFTEVNSIHDAPRLAAIGYRADDGNTGWNVTFGTRGAYCAACISPVRGGGPVWFF